MNHAAALFVSKRLQPVFTALLVLAAAQLVAASCTPEMVPMGSMARVVVPIGR